jgi:hypothetical protein
VDAEQYHIYADSHQQTEYDKKLLHPPKVGVIIVYTDGDAEKPSVFDPSDVQYLHFTVIVLYFPVCDYLLPLQLVRQLAEPAWRFSQL